MEALMQISREADYAVRTILYLARLSNTQAVATGLIAKSQHIPPSFLAKIVSRLSTAGIVRTRRGPSGGVSLARASSEISVLEVIEVIDGPLTVNECVLNPERCPLVQTCTLQALFCDARASLIDRLRQATFDQLIYRG